MAIERAEFYNSSNLASATYDTDTGELTITFRSGLDYPYSNVPPEKWSELRAASSPGKYFHANIRDDYA